MKRCAFLGRGTLLECDVYVADRVTLSIFIVDGRRHSSVLSRGGCLHAIRMFNTIWLVEKLLQIFEST